MREADAAARPTDVGADAEVAALRDRFRWLEDDDDPEVVAWQGLRDAAAREWLESAGDLSGIADELKPHLEAMHVQPPRTLGGRWITSARREGRTLLTLGSALRDPDASVLFDPHEIGAADVEGFWPSPDGSMVAVAVRLEIGGAMVLHLVRADGSLAGRGGPMVAFPRGVWDPSGSAVYYGGVLPAEPHAPPQVFRLAVDDGQARQVGLLAHPSTMVQPLVSRDGRRLVAVSGFTSPQPLAIWDLHEGGGWQPFLTNSRATFQGVLLADNYLAVTDEGADRGRVVRIPLASWQDKSRWQEVVPESDVVLRGLDVIGDVLVVAAIRDGQSCLRVVPLSSPDDAWDVPLERGTAIGTDARSWSHMPLEEPGFCVDGDSAIFLSSTFRRSPEVRRLKVSAGAAPEVELLLPAEFSHEELSVRRGECTSRDGMALPLWVVELAGATAPDAPCIVYGYGGWNNAFLPVYLAGFLPLLRQGVRVVMPSLRGGGEAGRAWWAAGRREHKHRTVDDLEDVVAFLREHPDGAPRRLAVMGASLGGMHALSLMTRRPDLMDAVVALVPVTDMLHDVHFADGYGPIGEYGDPADDDFLDYVLRYSPFQAVRPARLPATLIACAQRDQACPPAESRKMVARLAEAEPGGQPLLLRCWPDSDHISGELGTSSQTAEWVSFLGAVLGLGSPAAGDR